MRKSTIIGCQVSKHSISLSNGFWNDKEGEKERRTSEISGRFYLLDVGHFDRGMTTKRKKKGREELSGGEVVGEKK